MKAVLISAAPASHEPTVTLRSTVEAELAAAGYDDIRPFELTSMKLAFCQGEFDCWVKTPGVCRAHDAEAEIVAAVHDADALVYVGPLAFGGHAHVVKRLIERMLCLLLPFFTHRDHLTHHERRYATSPRMFSFAWAPEASAEERATFSALNDANAVNYDSPGCGALVLVEGDRARWGAEIGGVLAAPRVPGSTIVCRAELRAALLSAAASDQGGEGPTRVRRVALLVGSPKIQGTSASETIARALVKRMEPAGISAEMHRATEFVHDDARSAASARAIAGADLFVLVTPLYADSIPALATHALELVAAARAERGPDSAARFAIVVNCGFPEAEQNRTALRIARIFSNAAGYAWGGGLALGGGGVVQPGSALDEAHGPVAHVVRALDLAAPALAAGRALPQEAIEAMAETPMPDVLYRVMGDLGWRWTAFQNSVSRRELKARPLDAPNEAPRSSHPHR